MSKHYRASLNASRAGYLFICLLLVTGCSHMSSAESELFYAAGGGDLPRAKAAIEAGANPNVREDEREDTPLMRAAANSHAKMVRYLLDHGADPKLRNENDSAALDMTTDPALKRMLINGARKTQ